ncbi:M48 family metallopeptidase [Aestuariirhabdus sp. LZHN29]|uniref:M48 metallopeptidase family protein n=1 Tax=Aestuariirhabdus sp. LZHN29 TaxID=3417462 RepID=UPI003CF76495
MSPTNLRYLQGYSPALLQQASALVESGRLPAWLRERYNAAHDIRNDKSLYLYVIEIKQRFLKQSGPLSKVVYDDRIDVLNHALGLHTRISRVQGGKLKAKREIRIASLFRDAPPPMLEMIVVHELAHLREMDHNKAFYKLCCHMQPDYHQRELDTRLYLTCLDQFGPL